MANYWDILKMLYTFILDYLKKKKLYEAATTFSGEALHVEELDLGHTTGGTVSVLSEMCVAMEEECIQETHKASNGEVKLSNQSELTRKKGEGISLFLQNHAEFNRCWDIWKKKALLCMPLCYLQRIFETHKATNDEVQLSNQPELTRKKGEGLSLLLQYHAEFARLNNESPHIWNAPHHTPPAYTLQRQNYGGTEKTSSFGDIPEDLMLAEIIPKLSLQERCKLRVTKKSYNLILNEVVSPGLVLDTRLSILAYQKDANDHYTFISAHDKDSKREYPVGTWRSFVIIHNLSTNSFFSWNPYRRQIWEIPTPNFNTMFSQDVSGIGAVKNDEFLNLVNLIFCDKCPAIGFLYKGGSVWHRIDVGEVDIRIDYLRRCYPVNRDSKISWLVNGNSNMPNRIINFDGDTFTVETTNWTRLLEMGSDSELISSESSIIVEGDDYVVVNSRTLVKETDITKYSYNERTHHQPRARRFWGNGRFSVTCIRRTDTRYPEFEHYLTQEGKVVQELLFTPKSSRMLHLYVMENITGEPWPWSCSKSKVCSARLIRKC